jgi:hypothetical protein
MTKKKVDGVFTSLVIQISQILYVQDIFPRIEIRFSISLNID